MSMPRFDDTLFPILDVLKDGKPRSLKEVSDIILEKYFSLTEEEKREVVSSGRTRFFDRVGWGRTYLKKAGLIYQPERGSEIQITKEGENVVKSGITKINQSFLSKYESFLEFRKPNNQNKTEDLSELDSSLSPQDMIDQGFEKIRQTLKSDLLEKLYKINPYYFERVVLILFKKMGYGDFQETPKSGDGGIDGIISQDLLGLDKIYMQAKRYGEGHKVRELEIRNFIGAMDGDVSKGIFVTTSSFDSLAIQKAKNSNAKIILIDGDKLADLMIEHDIGIQIKNKYDVKEIDDDFFEEE